MSVHAFTIEAGVVLESIVSQVSVRQSERLCQLQNLQGGEESVQALWDTGANHSCVSARLAQRLGLINVDAFKVVGVAGVFRSFVHLIDVVLPNAVSIRNVKVTEFIDDNDFDVIIGMDIITCGDFAVSNYGRETVVSFRIPSQAPPIDFRNI
jgi:predicted aspartyl protease